MRTQRRVAEILAAISLIGLALGFSVLGILIVANEHDGASMTGGSIHVLVGAAFLITAFLHWKRCEQIQGGFQVEEVPATQIVSEMRQIADALW